MENKNILILGSGHLAHRIKTLAKNKGFEITHIPRDILTLQDDELLSEKLKVALKETDISSISMVYIVDDKDEHNLELLIAITSINENIPIALSLFNENIAPHLQAAHPNIKVYSPARIAAPVFVEALYKPVERTIRYSPVKQVEEIKKVSKSDRLIKILVACFIVTIFFATTYFHMFENLSWLDSLYFVIVTVATVGYGDINLLAAQPVSKVVDIILILSSTFFIWMIFSLTIDRIIKKRIQLGLGRKQYNYKNHIILCGLGKLGYFIAEELIKKGEEFIIIESNEDSRNVDYFRNKGIDIYIGNASFPDVLKSVGVINAKALISVINDDYLNLEVGLNARSFKPDMRLILRIFDEATAEKIKDSLDIHLTLSMSAVVDEKIFNHI